MTSLADVGSHIQPGAFWLALLLGCLAVALGVGVKAYRDARQAEREAQALRLRRLWAQMDSWADQPYDQEADRG